VGRKLTIPRPLLFNGCATDVVLLHVGKDMHDMLLQLGSLGAVPRIHPGLLDGEEDAGLCLYSSW
jgi:hypothetical protein